MNKKVLYFVLAVLLLIAIAALIAFGGSIFKDYPDYDSGLSVGDTSIGSTGDAGGNSHGSNDTPSGGASTEDEPPLGLEDSVFGDSSSNRPGSTTSTTLPNRTEGSANSGSTSKPTGTTSTSSSSESSTPEEEPIDLAEYERFLKMTSDEQRDYVDSFPDMDAFFKWYNASKQAYDKQHPPIDVGDGNINIGDIIEGQN